MKKIVLGGGFLLFFLFSSGAHAFWIGCSDGGGGTDVSWNAAGYGQQTWEWTYSNTQNDDPSPLVEAWLSPNSGSGGKYKLIQYPGGPNVYDDFDALGDYEESDSSFVVARVECDGSITNDNDFGGNFSGSSRQVSHNGTNVSPVVITSGESVTISWNFAYNWEAWVNGPNGYVNKNGDANPTGGGNANYTWNSPSNFSGVASFETCVRGPANGTICETVYVDVDPAPLGSITVTSNHAGASWCINNGLGCGSGGAYFSNLNWNTYTMTSLTPPANYDCTPDVWSRQINAGDPDKSFNITCTPTNGPPVVDILCSQNAGASYIQGPCSTTTGIVQWSAVNATSCTATATPPVAAWSGAKAVTGTQNPVETLPAGTNSRIYTLSCSNAFGTTVDSVVVNRPGVPVLTLNAITSPRNAILGSGATPGTITGTISGGSGSGYGVSIIIRRGNGSVCNDWTGTGWTVSPTCSTTTGPAVAGNNWTLNGTSIPPTTAWMNSGETYRIFVSGIDGAGTPTGWAVVSPFILYDTTPPTGTINTITTPRSTVLTSNGSSPGIMAGNSIDPIPAGTRVTGGPFLASGVNRMSTVIREWNGVGSEGACDLNNRDWNGSAWVAACTVYNYASGVLSPPVQSTTWSTPNSPPLNQMTSGRSYRVSLRVDDAAGNTGWSQTPLIAFQANRTPDGTLDVILEPGIAAGWSVDRDTPSQNVEIHLYVDGPYPSVPISGVTITNLPRADVSAWCTAQTPSISCPLPGFGWTIPPVYRNNVTHTVYAYGIDTSGIGGYALAGNPKSFIFPAPTVTNVRAAIPDYCISGPSATVSWQYNDAANGTTSFGATSQSQYQVQIDNDPAFASPEWDSGIVSNSVPVGGQGSNAPGPCNASNPVGVGTGTCRLTWNATYRARVRVWDTDGNASPWTNQSLCTGTGCTAPETSWVTPLHAYPTNVNTFGWVPQKPEAGEIITFNPGSSTCYAVGGAPTLCPDNGWDWTFSNGTLTPDTVPDTKNPQRTFPEIASYDVTLSVRDNEGYICSAQKTINVVKPIPWWKEVLPGS